MLPSLVNYVIAFLLAIASETAVAWLLGYRRRLELACVLAVNVFSHPLLTLIIWSGNEWFSSPFGWSKILLMEAGVVAIEWRLMCFALPNRTRSGLFFLTLAMNGVSYLAGCCVPWLNNAP